MEHVYDCRPSSTGGDGSVISKAGTVAPTRTVPGQPDGQLP